MGGQEQRLALARFGLRRDAGIAYLGAGSIKSPELRTKEFFSGVE
jgi:hypothetical protein